MSNFIEIEGRLVNPEFVTQIRTGKNCIGLFDIAAGIGNVFYRVYLSDGSHFETEDIENIKKILKILVKPNDPI